MQINAWFLLITAALVVLWKIDFFVSLLNMRALRPDVPEAFRGFVDADTYARSQEYTRAKTVFGLGEATFSLVLLFAFWWLGGFGWLDGWVRSLGQNSLVSGLIFLSVLMLGLHLVGLPLELYDTFGLEAKFGFNRTTPGTWLADQIKGLVLGAVLGLPLLALLLWLFETVPLAWLWGWLAVSGFSLLLSYVAPAWILPLFNRYEPLPDGELKTAIHEMAEKCGFPLKEVSVMDGSKRSTKSNAFFTGFGRNKRIALFDTLVEKHSVPELVAVLAHEIGHYKKRHILQGMVAGVLTTGALFFLLGMVLHNRSLFDAFGVEHTSAYVSLVLFAILARPLHEVLSVAGNAWSRKNEFEADAYAAEVTGDPGSLASALRRLSTENLSNLTPHPFHVFLHYSHPPVGKRIAALERR